MQHTNKMVMVPQETYSSLMSQQKQSFPPVVQQMSNLDQELQTILSNPNLSPELKYHQYKQVFNRYQQLRSDHFQSKPYVPMVATDIQTGNDIPTEKIPIETERRLIERLPKNVRPKGKILLDHVKDNSQTFNWLESGELVVDGKHIPGSNIIDLVHHVTRKRPSAKPPVGSDEFQQLLTRTNVPKEALNNSDTFGTPTGLGTIFSPVRQSPKAKKTPVKRPQRTVKPVDKYGLWKRY